MSSLENQITDSYLSLAQAAKITGYHQDYLGQLCRGGKLYGQKRGRNWFTTEEAVQEFLRSIQIPVQAQPNIVIEAEPTPAPTPTIEQNLVVSEVSGVPIALRSKSAAPTNRLQDVINTIKIDALHREFSELKEAVEELAVQVQSHEQRFEEQAAVLAPSLKHNYASNFDMGSIEPVREEELVTLEDPQIEIAQPSIRWVGWLVPAAGAAAILLILALTGFQFFGDSNKTTTVYYHKQAPAEQRVAGDTTEIIPVGDRTMPTLPESELTPQSISGSSASTLLQ